MIRSRWRKTMIAKPTINNNKKCNYEQSTEKKDAEIWHH